MFFKYTAHLLPAPTDCTCHATLPPTHSGGGRGRGKRLLNRGMNNGNYIGKRSETGGAGPSTEGALSSGGL